MVGDERTMIDEKLPNVNKAVDLLFRDWGLNPVEPILPNEYDWERVERFLNTLTEVDLEALASGELSASNRIVSRYPEEGEYAMNAMAEVFEQHIGSIIAH